MNKAFFLFFLLINCFSAFAKIDTLAIHEDEGVLITNRFFEQIEDPGKNLTIHEVLNRHDFTRCKSMLPSLKMSNPVIWLKLIVKNKTTEANVRATIGSTVIDQFDIYAVNGGVVEHFESEQPDKSFNYFTAKETVISCPLKIDSVRTLYVRIQSNYPNIIPIKVYSEDEYWEGFNAKNTTFGVFAGILMIMMVYNMFLFFIVKDKSYLYYVIYVIFLGTSQAVVHGYGTSIVSPLLMNNYILPLIRILLWLSIILFINEFLQLKNQYSKIYQYYRLLYITSALPALFFVFGYANIGFNIISFNAIMVSVALLIIGIWLYLDGVTHAKFFMVAWTLFLVSVIISIARNKDFIPYNDFTSNLFLLGVVFELVLFSVALADKINFYRDQNNQAQFLALKIAKENEKLITEQNIQLENKVLHRTKELLESNKSLMSLVTNLKAAQSQLIETEKMASLGQLTAGIAHEINNPINFVKSNIKPLKLDFNDIFELLDRYTEIESKADYQELFKDPVDFKQKIDINFIKKEITDLLNGIEEGASRTAEIVQSLRAFSRTDEVELKPADINKSILSSLVLLRNIIPYYIEITPVFDKLEPINCYPGKLNQVFMNLIHNSIQAITEKKTHNKESILIVTKDYPDNISIEITDTGVGMADHVKQKMFDPFFTTKGVGEGTGLGLSIVFGIIEKHKGAIDVKSKPGKGTTIIIMLPKTLS